MATAKVFEVLAQARESMELLNRMPALAPWERETRMKAIHQHTRKEVDKWLKAKFRRRV